MGNILNLLKLQIDNKTDLLKMASPKKMIVAILKVLLVLALITVAVALVLLRILSLGIAVSEGLVAIVLLATQGISLFFAIGNIINTLYLCKDNEMLICLPVTPNQLFISKVLLIYLRELAVNAMISIPLFITLGFLGGLGASFYLSIPILVLLLPIFPIVLASFISIPLMGVIRFLKKHVVLSILCILGLVAACLWGYISLIGAMAGNFNIANQQLETVRKINQVIATVGKHVVVYVQLAKAMLSFTQWFWYPLFLLLCAGVSMLTVLAIRPLYFKIAMSSLENTIKSKEKKRPLKKSSPFFSLIKKETLCIFRSPTDIFEYFLFTLLMPFIVFSYDQLLTTITVNQAGTNMIAGAHVMVVAILAMLSNIVSASAISRDGGNFYTSKIVPVNYYAQIFAKLAFNAIFTCGALFVTMFVSFLTEGAVVWHVILGTVAVMFAAIGHIAWSIDMDIKDPTINLQGDEASSITSRSTPKSVAFGLVIGFILGIIIILMSYLKTLIIPYLLIIVLSFVFAVYRIYILVLRSHLCYNKIEM